MTPRSLFSIILKIIGLFFIRDFLALIPQLFSSFLFFTASQYREEAIWSIITTLMILLIYWLVAYFLIFKTNLVIDQLGLDKGFAQTEFPLNIHRSTILSIATMVVGGLLVADELPNFCKQLFIYFQEKRLTYGQSTTSVAYLVVSGVKIIIGLVLMIGQRPIVNLIELQRKK